MLVIIIIVFGCSCTRMQYHLEKADPQSRVSETPHLSTPLFLILKARNMKNQFHTFTYSWCIGLSAILQSDWSRAFWPMTQRIFLEMGFVMRGQELHEFSLGLFSAKLITKLMKKTNKISYFGSFLSKYGQNWISHK